MESFLFLIMSITEFPIQYMRHSSYIMTQPVALWIKFCLLYFAFSWAALLFYPEQVQMIQLWTSLHYGKIVPYFGHSYIVPWAPAVGCCHWTQWSSCLILSAYSYLLLNPLFLNKRDRLAIRLWVGTAMPLQGDSALLGSLFLLLTRGRLLL